MSLPTTHHEDPLAIYAIGLKLRTLRTAKNLTLTRLASQTQLSTALLSKLETDRMVPTLQTLEKICRVYGISLGHFFCEPQHHSVAITRKEHVAARRGDQPTTSTPLHVPTAESRQLSRIIEIPAGVSVPVGECGIRSELTAYVIDGALNVSVAGSHEVLQSGDSLVVITDQPMVWSAAESACKVLSVFAHHSPGQRSA